MRYLLIFQLVFVLALSSVSSRPIPFEFARPIYAAVTLWTAGLAFLITRTGLGSLSHEHPLARFGSSLKEESKIVIRAFWLALVLGFSIALHGWAKSMIPYVTTYWADPILADFDKWVFGQDPWRLFRSELLAPVYATVYTSWFVITFGTLGLLAFSKRDQSRVLFAYFATLIVCGTLGQYILPSAGPMFYERIGFGTRFNELVQTNDPIYTMFADFLWDNYAAHTANIGTGISAMPSMHVGLAAWSAIALTTLWRPLIIPAVIYVFLIWCASIASGWHYSSDGVVSILASILIWKVSDPQWFRIGIPAAISFPRLGRRAAFDAFEDC
ncbi:phosphatase PAP2 family protein [Sphingomonas hankyongi]|uniref:Phosphatase PAP2 family protein n=1 Tax=Sphingomonas hankyongi TaxID=2908209 RepID=A0ABT0S2T1_9SPHN|nr:phosphatase PAP2 family protein [Sphingomonas hankyongi]MCL6730177.1 phosphatase PAP2 family protein [Sphingomonas hankyongi]